MDKRVDQMLQGILHTVNEEDDQDIGDEDLPFLFRILHGLASSPSCFFLQLSVKEFNQIERNSTSADDAFVLGLQKWLRGGTASRKELITAIFIPSGGNHRRLASDLANSFKDMRDFKPIEVAIHTSTQKIYDAKAVTTMLGGKVAHRWYQMGVILGSQLSDLEAIRVKNFTAQKSEEEMFKKWLANCSEIATWQRLVDAVGHKAGGDHLRLASELSKNIDTEFQDTRQFTPDEACYSLPDTTVSPSSSENSPGQRESGSIQTNSASNDPVVRRRLQPGAEGNGLTQVDPNTASFDRGWHGLLRCCIHCPSSGRIMVALLLILLTIALMVMIPWTKEAAFFLLFLLAVGVRSMWKNFFQTEIPWRDFHLDKTKGVLVLVTSTYEGTRISALKGTETDRKEMERTFKELGYNVIQLKNKEATKSAIFTILHQLSDYLSQYTGPTTDRALVFAFSGHGGYDDTLLSHDGSKLSLMKDILPRFVEHSGVFEIRKFFFIDACRGSSRLTKSLDQIVKDYEATNKGLSHEEGNFLIAHATISEHVSYDEYWMHKLAKKIRAHMDSHVPLTKILDDLAEEVPTNQQPEYTSRLRGSFEFRRNMQI